MNRNSRQKIKMNPRQNESPGHSTQTSPSASKKNKSRDMTREKTTRNFRENQQLRIYLFVSAIIAIAWVFGTLEFSFTYVFGLMALVFIVWRGKVMKLIDEHILQQETLLHRRRALQHHETTEWLNFIINRW